MKNQSLENVASDILEGSALSYYKLFPSDYEINKLKQDEVLKFEKQSVKLEEKTAEIKKEQTMA
ncbi:MAG: hypothetical protein EOM50_14035, partial [Erysipelotrichia bacterium]|nr:hypothetical protein [Erysipelotrichia bacterium]